MKLAEKYQVKDLGTLGPKYVTWEKRFGVWSAVSRSPADSSGSARGGARSEPPAPRAFP
jgi:hypothetical protein